MATHNDWEMLLEDIKHLKRGRVVPERDPREGLAQNEIALNGWIYQLDREFSFLLFNYLLSINESGV
jgi:hypothetical protein